MAAAASASSSGAVQVKEEDKPKHKDNVEDEEEEEEVMECCVCLEKMSLPWKNPNCTHAMCFLCIKAACTRSARCPLCRAEIDVDEFDKAQLVVDASANLYGEQKYRWLYKGGKAGGWWQFEMRQNEQIEQLFQLFLSNRDVYRRADHPLQIGATMYTYDFIAAKQINAAGRSRGIARSTQARLARDHGQIIKGIGGVKIVTKAKAKPTEVEAEVEEEEEEEEEASAYS